MMTSCFPRKFPCWPALIPLLLLLGCGPDGPYLGKPLADAANLDFVALQCDRTEYVVMDTLPFFDWKGYMRNPDPRGPKETTLNLPHLRFSIEETLTVTQDVVLPHDTTVLSEWVGEHVSGKLFHVIPKNRDAKVKVFWTITENILEQFNRKTFYKLSPAVQAEREKNRVHWEGNQTVILEDSADYYFRIPIKWRDQFEKRREFRFALRDTLVYYESEGGSDYGTLVYHDKVCYYLLPEGYLELVIENPDGTVLRHWLKIIYIYEC